MSRIGLLVAGSDAEKTVIERLADTERITKARVHPIAVLAALITYQNGRGARGQNTWTPAPRVVDALDGAFYTSFGNVEPTGKRHLLALDVSSSMEWGEIAGIPGLTPRVASAAMALITASTGDSYKCVAFTAGVGAGGYRRGAELTPLSISPRQRLDDVVRLTSKLDFGGTDCSLPMLWAADNRREFDAFIVYTDSETWAGRTHPSQALVEYRRQFVPDAKMAVVGMVANAFSIADPNDPGQMDVVGFDTNTPNLISGFIRGDF